MPSQTTGSLFKESHCAIHRASCTSSPLQTTWIHLVLQQPSEVKPWHPSYKIPCSCSSALPFHFPHTIPIGLAQSLSQEWIYEGICGNCMKMLGSVPRKIRYKYFLTPVRKQIGHWDMQEWGNTKRELHSCGHFKKRLKHGTFLPCSVTL